MKIRRPVNEPRCRECDRLRGVRVCRGLCHRCSLDPEVRNRHPISSQAPRPLTAEQRRDRDLKIVGLIAGGARLRDAGPAFGLSHEGARLALRRVRLQDKNGPAVRD